MIKVTVVGNVVRDPQTFAMKDGGEGASFSVAGKCYKSDDVFFNVKIFGKRAGYINSSVGKGTRICVTGTLSQSKYTKKDGSQGTSLDIVADDFEILDRGRRPENEEAGVSY